MSFMGSVISLDRSSATSGRISVIQDRLSGLCRLDLRASCGRRLLLLQLLVVPSIPLILMTSLTLWKLIDISIYTSKLSRFDVAITEQQHSELAIAALNDELLATISGILNVRDDAALENSYRITDTHHIHDPDVVRHIRKIRDEVRVLRNNGTFYDVAESHQRAYCSACYDVTSAYLYVIGELSGTEERSVVGGLPHEVYSHWYAARSLITVRLQFAENCAYGALAIASGNASKFDSLEYAEGLDVSYYHILDIIALDPDQGRIFNDSVKAELDRMRSFNYLIAENLTAIRNDSLATLGEWERVCETFENRVFPAMRKEIYHGLHAEGIEPAANGLRSLLGFHIFCILIELPVLLFILENGRITSISIFSSVNMFSSRVAEIKKEKYKTEQLLKEMLPRTIARQLLSGKRSGASFYEQVTVSFSDIVDFNEVSKTSKPVEIVGFLNEIYNFMDGKIECYDVYKVETIGSVYMVASGLPIGNGDRHVTEVASMALDLIKSSKTFTVAYLPGYRLQLRFGIHTGSCCAGVVGNKMPRYCLFGDTVNTASRMQSSGEALKIQITRATYEILEKKEKYVMQERGQIAVKGKGKMITYWLLSDKSAHSLATNNRVHAGGNHDAFQRD